METKVCKRCGKEKPLEEFHKNSASKDGRALYCRECANMKWKTEYGYEYKKRKVHAYTKDILFPLAYIGYKALKKKYGTVDYDTVTKYIYTTRGITEKGIELMKMYEEQIENAEELTQAI